MPPGRDAGVVAAQARRARPREPLWHAETASGDGGNPLTSSVDLRPDLLRGDSAFRCTTVPANVRALIEHELALIAELGYEPYFLTVHDIVAFARSKNILCQGRGSAANSAVCYALGITEVDPCAHADAVRALHLARSATSRPTSTSISSTSGARR